ncbi:acetyl-CoA carboxylase biotin carboxyl carrier protein subunit [Thermicanus aegyptius]|uniref:acetyl-CoA carboxylase biotin carboxyl carrier protein subunit n=1 Tax=Thermicanus aegyptius TaxID=94009 RepID=UPI0003FC3FF6|nr:acetyl-CoA carboxylase biotin carboxyl carrier protein subunit [Thermicanus aegyptius]
MKEVRATMAGTVIRLTVSVGDEVTEGQDAVILESMKMEIPQTVEEGGRVKEMRVRIGDFVNEGDLLLVLE